MENEIINFTCELSQILLINNNLKFNKKKKKETRYIGIAKFKFELKIEQNIKL